MMTYLVPPLHSKEDNLRESIHRMRQVSVHTLRLQQIFIVYENTVMCFC